MKHRVSTRTQTSFDAEEQRLKDIRDHVAELKAQHDSQQDFDFGTKGTCFLCANIGHIHIVNYQIFPR